ncbi:MAG: hypothetical protein ACREOO_00085 [bacterium]
MKAKSLVFVLALVAAMTTVTVLPSARACTCVTVSPERAFEVADAVFSAKILSFELDSTRHLNVAEVEVVKIWKGSQYQLGRVFTAVDGATCGYYFLVGETYLIYANIDEGEPPGTGQLYTTICSRTTPLHKATADLKHLDGEKDSACCGSKNILAGDVYLFLGMILYLLQGHKLRQISSNRETA